MTDRPGVIAEHASMLPATLTQAPVSLGEGNTPLLRLEHIPAKHGLDLEIYCKFEGTNPTGSFKDRGMAVAITAARQEGARAVICASTGNTAAAASAYAARAGMECIVLLPAGKVAAGKLAQARAHGARILAIEGNFDAAMHAVQQLDATAVVIVNSINPMRIQGQKTIVFEVCNQLGRLPNVHALPVGNAGNITAHWIGYCEVLGRQTQACNYCAGNCKFALTPSPDEKPPKLLGVQATGAAPFLQDAPVAQPETVATAIRIGNPQSWDQAKAAVHESKGRFIAVDDATLLATQKELADQEGIFCEPASAAGLAGVINQAKEGAIKAKSLVVCTLTGHGLKDPEIFAGELDVVNIAADPTSIKAALNLD